MKLLERASQLQALNSALSQVKARAGQGCVVLIYREAGISKTSLVEHFIKEHKLSWRTLQDAVTHCLCHARGRTLHDIALPTQGNLLQLLDSESNHRNHCPIALARPLSLGKSFGVPLTSQPPSERCFGQRVPFSNTSLLYDCQYHAYSAIA